MGRARDCVGTPPRQTEDPQSPPCVGTIFEGDNGGATSLGVTSTEIRVAVPLNGTTTQPVMEAYFEYFNRRFEFYGRRLTPVFIPTATTGDPVSNRSFAQDVAATNPFAAMTAELEWYGYLRTTFVQELARAGVVSTMAGLGMGFSDQLVFDALDPYVWSVQPSLEDIERNLADFFCTSLAGKPAVRAGDSPLQSAPRKLGIVVVGAYTMPSSRALEDGLASGCDARPVVVQYDRINNSSDVLRNGLQLLKTSGVTTVTCICTYQGQFESMTSVAHDAGYHPEWILASHQRPSDETAGQSLHATARPNAMLFSDRERLLPPQARPFFQALQSVNPNLVSDLRTNGSFFSSGRRAYPQLLLLAAGIQGAGPNLTPQSFAAALMSMQFPNAGAGQRPFWQPAVGFGPGDHSMISDYALGWWNPGLPSLEPAFSGPQGSWCYLGGGARYRVGGFPADAIDRFFDPSQC